LKIGFVLIHKKAHKALVACHTLSERAHITQIVARSLGPLVGNVIATNELPQLARAQERTLSHLKRKDYLVVLNKLGEKCTNMSDSNCRSCLDDRQFLCLRSLLARFMRNPLLLQHKNIELCDLEGEFDHQDGRVLVFVFSKLNKGKTGLTLRNSNGAVLLGQIIQHVDKKTFNTIGVLSSSTTNEDLKERLTFLGGLTGKSIIFFDDPILVRMLAEFEEQAVFEKLDLEMIYKVSTTKGLTLNDGEKLSSSLSAPA
jgi:hypothetical protein